MINGRIENLWWKLLLVVLMICGVLILIGYLYYRNSSCSNPLDCLEFEIIIAGGGIMVLSLPIVIILFFWEMYKKVREKREDNNF